MRDEGLRRWWLLGVRAEGVFEGSGMLLGGRFVEALGHYPQGSCALVEAADMPLGELFVEALGHYPQGSCVLVEAADMPLRELFVKPLGHYPQGSCALVKADMLAVEKNSILLGKIGRRVLCSTA